MFKSKRIMIAALFLAAATTAIASPDFGDYFKQDPKLAAYVECQDNSSVSIGNAAGSCFDLPIQIANEHFNGDLFALHNWWLINEADARRGVKHDFS